MNAGPSYGNVGRRKETKRGYNMWDAEEMNESASPLLHTIEPVVAVYSYLPDGWSPLFVFVVLKCQGMDGV